jgi:riboflavin synthase
MFTGLVETTGACVHLRQTDDERSELAITAPDLAAELHVGESLAVNGCCLTVTRTEGDRVLFDLLDETLRRTNLGHAKPGARLNLERSLAANGRLGGHFVQGHVDTTVRVTSVERKSADTRLEFELPAEFAGYVAFKGSVAVNGVSLTVAEAGDDRFAIWMIPHTAAATNLGDLRPEDLVNLECDMLAKYVERLLATRQGK